MQSVVVTSFKYPVFLHKAEWQRQLLLGSIHLEIAIGGKNCLSRRYGVSLLGFEKGKMIAHTIGCWTNLKMRLFFSASWRLSCQSCSSVVSRSTS